MTNTAPRTPRDPYNKDGDLDGAWIDDVQRRMFLEVERELTALEHLRDENPARDMREKLELIERMLRIKRLLIETGPSHVRKLRKRRAKNVRKRR